MNIETIKMMKIITIIIIILLWEVIYMAVKRGDFQNLNTWLQFCCAFNFRQVLKPCVPVSWSIKYGLYLLQRVMRIKWINICNIYGRVPRYFLVLTFFLSLKCCIYTILTWRKSYLYVFKIRKSDIWCIFNCYIYIYECSKLKFMKLL